jgi:hypothetical protein
LDTNAVAALNQQAQRAQGLADAAGRPVTQLLDEAADALERRVFFDHFSLRYGELRSDPTAWSEIETERSIEGAALNDNSA